MSRKKPGRYVRSLVRNGRLVFRSKLYRCWIHMRTRCTNLNATQYYRYGGRGISVCSEWDDYDVFRTWAINNGVKRGLTLDRIDNDGDYTSSNCRWATSSEQAVNRIDNRLRNSNGTYGGVI